MKSEIHIHPSAAENFNKKANEILSFVHKYEDKRIEFTESSSFKSARIPHHQLDEQEYIVNYNEGINLKDSEGKFIEFSFEMEGVKYFLDKNNYHLILSLSKQILSCFRDKISEKFSKQLIYNWIKLRFSSENSSISFDKYLKGEIKNNVRDITCYVPVANLEIEGTVLVGRHELRPLSEEMIDTWKGKLLSNTQSVSDNEHKENIEMLIQDIRCDYQGLAIIVCNYNAEEYHAHHIAREEAKNIISILAIFLKDIIIPNMKLSLGNIKEEDFISRTTSISFSGDRFAMYRGFKRKMTTVPYHRLDKKYIKLLHDLCFEKISCLLAKEEKNLNKFQERILASLLMYSKSAFTAEPTEKIVYILTSLEIILLKNDNEPIQQNLAERFAFFCSNEFSKRKKLISIIRKIYSMRSKYLHHGYSSYEIEISSEFMREVWLFFMQLIAISDCFQNKDDFVCSIDDKKFGGGILLPKNAV
uniref:hypothetical protein n=1 Tax=Candidatus Electronema sp. TaxID=2698783 RepID=UPI0040579046